MSARGVRRAAVTLAYAALSAYLTNCSKASVGDDARGRGHAVAALPVALQVRAYDAAVRAAFDVGPSLNLLAAPSYLPRSSGYAPGDPVAENLLSALEARGVIGGSCVPTRERENRAPSCSARTPGYIIRFSPLFQLSKDSVELYLYSEVYAPSTGARPQPFSFEMAYQLARRGDAWRVVREGRVRQSGSSTK